MPTASDIMHPLFAWITFLLFLLLNAAFTICRDIVWRCSGLHAKIRQGTAETGDILEAHRMNIWFKHIIDIAWPVSLHNFILTHQDFVKPEYVLRDTVTLLQVTQRTPPFSLKGRKECLQHSPCPTRLPRSARWLLASPSLLCLCLFFFASQKRWRN